MLKIMNKNPSNLYNKVAIIVSSYDGFSDCWEPFLYGFKKYWPHCEFQAYLITNFKKSPDEGILKSIQVGEDKGWASNMKKAINSIEAEYIFYLQEDYWLNKKINRDELIDIIQEMIRYDWDYFRLIPSPLPDKNIEGKNYGRTLPKSKYRICLQAAIWKKSLLNEILFENESGWDFELNSELRVRDKLISSFCVNSGSENAIMSYCEGTAIRKAKWTRGALNYIEDENIVLDISKREIESRFETHLLRLGSKSLIMKIFAFLILRSLQYSKGQRNFISIFKY